MQFNWEIFTGITWNYYKLGFFLTNVSTSQNSSNNFLVINIQKKWKAVFIFQFFSVMCVCAIFLAVIL